MKEIERYSRRFRRLDKNRKRTKIYKDKIHNNVVKAFGQLSSSSFVFLVLFLLNENDKIELPNNSVIFMVVLIIASFFYWLRIESLICEKKKKIERFFKKIRIDNTSYKKLKHEINQLEQDEIDLIDSRLIDLMIKKEKERCKKNTGKLLNANILTKNENTITND